MPDIKIIYDIISPDLWNNQVFNYNVASIVDAIPLYSLAEDLRKKGYQVLTADVFLKLGDFSGLNLLITETETLYTQLLISKGCIPAICFCGESPLLIPKYYQNLSKKAGRFKHSFLFGGAVKNFHLSENKLHTYYWTNAKIDISKDVPWERRKFLTLINSNKNSSKPFLVRKKYDILPWMKIVLRYVRNWRAFHTFPGDIPDLYNTRIGALLYFSGNKEFDLYGQGWNKCILGVSENSQRMIRNSYRGLLPRGNENKHKTLRNYKFALCIENTEFPGYITEKIFDCILCGTIPVYRGAPDIDNFVPPGVFIDLRKYSSFNELEQYLNNLSPEQSEAYLDAATDFVKSPSFEKYYLTGWNRDIVQSLDEVINGQKSKRN